MNLCIYILSLMYFTLKNYYYSHKCLFSLLKRVLYKRPISVHQVSEVSKCPTWTH